MLIRWLYGQATFFDLLTWALGIVVAITVHEFAHAYAAFKSGDDTAKKLGRLSLNPLVHFDPVGTTLILVAGMGWGKPVPVDPWRFRNPRWDDVKVSFAGPASNLIVVAVLLAVARNISVPWEPWIPLVLTIVRVNLMLAFFNLIPLPPLDGSHILAGLLPPRQSSAYRRVFDRYGFLILIGLVMLAPGILHLLVWVPANAFLTVLDKFLGMIP